MTEEEKPKEIIPPSKETLSYLEKMKDPEYRKTMWKDKEKPDVSE